jgi:hypothetical protein
MDVGGRMGGVKEGVFIKGGACGDGVKDNETMGGWRRGGSCGEEWRQLVVRRKRPKRLSRRCCHTPVTHMPPRHLSLSHALLKR